MKEIKEIVDSVQLQEMDWQNTKETAKNNIREALVMLAVNKAMLAQAEKELRHIWASLSAEEQAKREKND